MSVKAENEIRGRNFVLFVVACILIVCIGFGGFFIGMTYEEKTNPAPKNPSNGDKDEVVEVLNTTDEVVVNAYEMVNKSISCQDRYFVSNKKLTPKDVDQKVISELVLSYLYNKYPSNGTSMSYTKAQVDEAATYLFGSQYSYSHGNIDSCPQYTYDAETGTYTRGEGGCGWVCGPYNFMSRIVRAQKAGNNLEIYVRVLFPNKDGDEAVTYYSDYDRTNIIGVRYDSDGVPYDSDDNYALGGLYKFTFANENDHYYFVSAEPVK